MTMRLKWWYLAMNTALVTMATAAQNSIPVVTELSGSYRNGQVFLTWAESATPDRTTFNVYSHSAPITKASLPQATKLAHHIEQHSARDWWQDAASFEPGTPSDPPIGFTIQDGIAPLDPSGGLFVHTVVPATAGARYYAVTWTGADGKEICEISPGNNSTQAPIEGRVEQTQPIWLGDGTQPAAQSAKGANLVLSLHGRGGGRTAGEHKSAVNCLWFRNSEQGWREGLPSKFHLRVSPTTVTITPMDRIWAGRPVMESRDRRDHCPAVNTWWYGYSETLYETTHNDPPIAPNYTERYLLALVNWAQTHLGTDPNATYLKGGSMGGSGTVAMVLHFPNVFAAAYAMVPVYSCTKPGKGSATRLECMCGPMTDRVVKTADGIPLLDYMNGARNIAAAKGDTPPIFATNGRQDGSIPWENNPPFYTAAGRARQAFAVFWNNGQHGMSSEAPDDVKDWSSMIYRYRLDESYPAFSNCSDNKDYGNGDKTDGDLIGWINRGLEWKDLVDTSDTYQITILAQHPDIQYPVTVDITPRRLQNFHVNPGDTLVVLVGKETRTTVKVDPQGLFTVPGVVIPDATGTAIIIKKH